LSALQPDRAGRSLRILTTLTGCVQTKWNGDLGAEHYKLGVQPDIYHFLHFNNFNKFQSKNQTCFNKFFDFFNLKFFTFSSFYHAPFCTIEVQKHTKKLHKHVVLKLVLLLHHFNWLHFLCAACSMEWYSGKIDGNSQFTLQQSDYLIFWLEYSTVLLVTNGAKTGTSTEFSCSSFLVWEKIMLRGSKREFIWESLSFCVNLCRVAQKNGTRKFRLSPRREFEQQRGPSKIFDLSCTFILSTLY
jgi:hypothetical protein